MRASRRAASYGLGSQREAAVGHGGYMARAGSARSAGAAAAAHGRPGTAIFCPSGDAPAEMPQAVDARGKHRRSTSTSTRGPPMLPATTLPAAVPACEGAAVFAVRNAAPQPPAVCGTSWRDHRKTPPRDAAAALAELQAMGSLWGVLQKPAGCFAWQNGFMSRKYLPVNREKPMFLPLDMQSWVPKDHFAWFLVDVVQQLDTLALQAGTSPGRGRPGYDPQMLATLVMYAMSCGERSSREIEDRTRTDAGFRVASGNQFPDHSTLCRFRQRAGGEDGPLEDLFTQVLYVCAVAGLGRLRVISVDGSKIWADASKEANRT